MKKILLAALVAMSAATPAVASGGLHCRTAGARPVEVNLAFGHVFGSPIVSSRLLDNGRNVPVSHAQWWLDRNEVRLVLIRPDAGAEELRLIARRNGSAFDGNLWRQGKRRWVRCREA